MTDFKDDEYKNQQRSFKEQILAELEKANQIRKEKEEELFQKEQEAKEAARRTAQLYAEYKRQDYLKKETATGNPQSDDQLAGNPSLSYPEHQSIPESTEANNETVDKNLETENPPASAADLETSREEVGRQEAFSDMTQEEVRAEKGEAVRRTVNKRQQTDRMAKKISTILISSIIIALLAVGLAGTVYVYSALNPVDKNSKEFVQVEIPSGSGNKLIGQILQKEGLIKNSTVFSFYTKFKNFTNFQSGYYNLQKKHEFRRNC